MSGNQIVIIYVVESRPWTGSRWRCTTQRGAAAVAAAAADDKQNRLSRILSGELGRSRLGKRERESWWARAGAGGVDPFVPKIRIPPMKEEREGSPRKFVPLMREAVKTCGKEG